MSSTLTQQIFAANPALVLPILHVKKVHPDAQLPVYASECAACFDLFAITVEASWHAGAHVYPGMPVTCRTGLAFDIPQGWGMFIYSRSGHGFKHATRLANAVGVIDSDYTGEVMVKLTCDHGVDSDNPLLFVKPGDRIAQAVLMPIQRFAFAEVNDLKTTARGAGGFGSTGA
jgi:dUTP pyrophosphatase